MSDLHAAYNALRLAHGHEPVPANDRLSLGGLALEAHAFISWLYTHNREREHWPELLAVERALRDLAEGRE